jgi:hypothetical protein
MDILAPVPKTPSKPVPPVLILPDYRTQTLLSLCKSKRTLQNKIPRRMIPLLRKPPPLISLLHRLLFIYFLTYTFITLSPYN